MKRIAALGLAALGIAGRFEHCERIVGRFQRVDLAHAYPLLVAADGGPPTIKGACDRVKWVSLCGTGVAICGRADGPIDTDATDRWPGILFVRARHSPASRVREEPAGYTR